MQEFLLRMRRSVLEEAVVEFDIVGKCCFSLSASRRRFKSLINEYMNERLYFKCQWYLALEN